MQSFNILLNEIPSISNVVAVAGINFLGVWNLDKNDIYFMG